MYCCTQARYHCFGTHYFCIRCHDVEHPRFGRSNIPLQDCNGVNCPLGVPHPPASSDHRKSAYSLGCGLCRSEAQSIGLNTTKKGTIAHCTADLDQVLLEIANSNKNDGKPDFIKMASEMAKEFEADELRVERIKNFYVNPMRVLTPRGAAKRERIVKRKLEKKLQKEQVARVEVQVEIME